MDSGLLHCVSWSFFPGSILTCIPLLQQTHLCWAHSFLSFPGKDPRVWTWKWPKCAQSTCWHQKMETEYEMNVSATEKRLVGGEWRKPSEHRRSLRIQVDGSWTWTRLHMLREAQSSWTESSFPRFHSLH